MLDKKKKEEEGKEEKVLQLMLQLLMHRGVFMGLQEVWQLS